jgi:short-subunit dehydrogenase
MILAIARGPTGTSPRQPLWYARRDSGLPAVASSLSGAIVNVLSLSALAAVPFSPAYRSQRQPRSPLSQSLRALLTGRGVKVHVVLPGPVETDMTRTLDIPKASPEFVARAIFDGVEEGEEEIFPDPMSESIAEGWRNGAVKALQQQFAGFVNAEPVKSKQGEKR